MPRSLGFTWLPVIAILATACGPSETVIQATVDAKVSAALATALAQQKPRVRAGKGSVGG